MGGTVSCHGRQSSPEQASGLAERGGPQGLRGSFGRAAVPVFPGICGSCSTMLSSGVEFDLDGAAVVERSRSDRLPARANIAQSRRQQGAQV